MLGSRFCTGNFARLGAQRYITIHSSFINAASPSGSASRSRGLARSGAIAYALIVLAATAVIAPMWFLGNASGHDFQFHMASWLDVSGQWRQGILYPRWAEWANFGFGEPRFIFYPPASWMLGAGLGTILPWRMVPGTFVWIALVLNGSAMWTLARRWLTPAQATAAAIFCAVNPYQLIVVYYRSDFAELLATALFPFVVLRAIRVIQDGWSELPALALVFAAVWLTNAPAAVLATYSLALMLFVGSVYRRAIDPLIAGGSAMFCGFGLAAFYILPAAREQRWVQIGQALTQLLRPASNFIFTHELDPEFLLFNWKVSSVAVGMILVAAVATVFVARRRRELALVWWLVAAVSAFASVLMFSPSAMVWRLLPKLAFVQFPWRWLGPLGFVFAFLLAAAPVTRKSQVAVWTLSALAIAGIGTAIVQDCWWDSEDIHVLAGGIRTGNGYEGTDEYQPLGSDRYNLPGSDVPYGDPPGPPAPLVTRWDDENESTVPVPPESFHVERWTAQNKDFTYIAKENQNVGVRLLSFPAWAAQVDGMDVKTFGAPGIGQVLVPVEAGKHRITLRFERTIDRTLADLVSLFFVLLVAAWQILVYRKSRTRESHQGQAS